MNSEAVKQRLELALANNEYIQIVFKYPDFDKRTFKKGYVNKIYDDSFDFDERFDGHATYSFEFIIEIVRWGMGK